MASYSDWLWVVTHGPFKIFNPTLYTVASMTRVSVLFRCLCRCPRVHARNVLVFQQLTYVFKLICWSGLGGPSTSGPQSQRSAPTGVVLKLMVLGAGSARQRTYVSISLIFVRLWNVVKKSGRRVAYCSSKCSEKSGICVYLTGRDRVQQNLRVDARGSLGLIQIPDLFCKDLWNSVFPEYRSSRGKLKRAKERGAWEEQRKQDKRRRIGLGWARLQPAISSGWKRVLMDDKWLLHDASL